MDMLNKELSSLVLKEREAKQRAYTLESQHAESKDELRLTQQELEGRTRENEHLISLLED